MRDTMIFYRSFYEAIKELPPENKIEVYDAIFSYSLDFSEPDLSGISKTIFTLIKPQLDANIKRFENGKKPKQKQKESETEAKQKQKESKTETNNNNNVNNNNNNNNNNNENINENILSEKETESETEGIINNSFVSINFDESIKNFKGNKQHFFLAYIFWDLWHKENPNSRTLKEAKVDKWIDDIRKIIEIDKTSFERLIGIYCYFVKCSKNEIGYDDFWYKTIKSVSSFRKKSKDGVYYIDQIIDKINSKREKDADFLRYVDTAIKKFNQNELLK